MPPAGTIPPFPLPPFSRPHPTSTMQSTPDTNATAEGLRICVITSAYHASITDCMRDAAVEAFQEAGGQDDDLAHITAPAAWELGVLAGECAHRDDIDAVVTLGCVITGETTHDRWINQGLSTALAALAVSSRTPVGFGVLTCASMEQAQARAGGSQGNKGRDTMFAVIAAARQLQTIRGTECES